MTVHHLKTHPEPFAAVLDGSKIHEFRKDDRNFQVGDILVLKEYDPAASTFSGRETCRRVTYKGTGFGIPEGWCCLSIKPILPPPPSSIAAGLAMEEIEAVAHHQAAVGINVEQYLSARNILRKHLAAPPLPNVSSAGIRAELKQWNLANKRIYQEVDGYYVYQPGPNGGYLSGYELMILAETLAEMNAEWNAQVQADPRLRERPVPPPSIATTVFDADDCPKCGGDFVGLAHSDGSWLDGTKVTCASCGHVGYVSADDDEAWLQLDASDHHPKDTP